jgi:hypothetical protein
LGFARRNFYPALFTLLYFIILVVAISFWWGTTKIKIKMSNSINKCVLYAETYYMLRFVQIRNNRYENRLIFLLLVNKNIVFP